SRAFYLPLPPLPASSLFPYTTLFRSSACSYFFVRCEGNADWAMWNLFFVDTFDHCHDFRNAGLVIRSEDGCAVCRDQSTAFQVRKMWESLYGKCSSACTKHHILSIVVRMQHGNDIMVAVIRNSVPVGDKTHFRLVFVTWSCRDFAVNKTLFIHMSLYPKIF